MFFLQNLVPCSGHNYGLTESQGVVGAKRGGLRMDAYVDDERQSPRPLGPRPTGLALNRPSAASRRLKGFYEPGSRRRLLASGRFKANQPVIMTGTGH